MSEDTPTKIEPTLKPVEDAPSIAADEPAAPETAEAGVNPDLKTEPAATFVAKGSKPQNGGAGKEPPVMPRAAQISIEPASEKSPPNWLRPVRAGEEKPEPAAAQPRSASRRFAMLAAVVAVAASVGAVAGSLGGARFGAPTQAAVPVHVAKDPTDDIRALKENVAQLRTTTKALSDNVSALKLSVSNANAQLTKMAETLERRAAAPAASPETTGSIQKPAPAAVVLGSPPAPLQHPVVPGWTLRRVYDGAALIEGREGIIEVEPGITIPGLGRIEDIKKQDGRWTVFTSKGIIVAGK
jgi:hypothetical protein